MTSWEMEYDAVLDEYMEGVNRLWKEAEMNMPTHCPWCGKEDEYDGSHKYQDCILALMQEKRRLEEDNAYFRRECEVIHDRAKTYLKYFLNELDKQPEGRTRFCADCNEPMTWNETRWPDCDPCSQRRWNHRRRLTNTAEGKQDPVAQAQLNNLEYAEIHGT